MMFYKIVQDQSNDGRCEQLMYDENVVRLVLIKKT